MENRLLIIKVYIAARQNNQVDILLSLLSNDASLFHYDGTIFSGKEALKGYYEKPQAMIPSISIPHYEKGEYFITLSILGGIKTIKAVFEFNDADLITKITLTSIGWI